MTRGETIKQRGATWETSIKGSVSIFVSSAGLRLSLLALQQGYLTPGTSGLSSPNFSISGNAMIQGTTAAGIAEVKALEVFNETMPPADVPTDHFIHAGCYVRTCRRRPGSREKWCGLMCLPYSRIRRITERA
nr:MAG TPA: hypothetical protein [Caudoviricetes sp.]